ncbi:MAG: hypothetical protein NT062_17905 [Proteobacteria bacterium]|nr:hypothetical protein [Pseudomonadota bacterium]
MKLDPFVAARRREDARELLAKLLPGGSPTRPIRVASASVIDGHAEHTLTCPRCTIGQFRVLEHTRPTPQLRRVDVGCRHCSTPRTVWFTIAPDEPN